MLCGSESESVSGKHGFYGVVSQLQALNGKATQWGDRQRAASDARYVCYFAKADQPARGTDGGFSI